MKNKNEYKYKNEYKCGCRTIRIFEEGKQATVGFINTCNLHQEELTTEINNAKWLVFEMLDHASGRIIE